MLGGFKPKLHYFNIQGRAEQIRLILKHAKVDFEDIRFDFGQWGTLKPQEPYKKFGAVPLLEMDGRVMNESHAIAKYLATKLGYYPTDIESAYEIDVVTN
jgi:glutathione S-transferase